MKFKNTGEPEKKRKPNRVVGGIEILYEGKRFTGFKVGKRLFKVTNNEPLKAFKQAEKFKKQTTKLKRK